MQIIFYTIINISEKKNTRQFTSNKVPLGFNDRVKTTNYLILKINLYGPINKYLKSYIKEKEKQLAFIVFNHKSAYAFL